jgi:catechol 2,3-dioxygenase-like lactoylglutathione lyase family enzyme
MGRAEHKPPRLRHILETCIYVSDMARALSFYEKVTGLAPQFSGDRISGFRVGDTMLLLFLRGGTVRAIETPGGTIPPHDGKGPAHFAFSIGQEDGPAWREHLDMLGIAIESTVRWPHDNATSLYFRDPDGHLVELATSGLWGID